MTIHGSAPVQPTHRLRHISHPTKANLAPKTLSLQLIYAPLSEHLPMPMLLTQDIGANQLAQLTLLLSVAIKRVFFLAVRGKLSQQFFLVHLPPFLTQHSGQLYPLERVFPIMEPLLGCSKLTVQLYLSL